MRRLPPTAFLALLAAACAHGPAPASIANGQPWPAPPAAPRVRLLALFPPPAEQRPRPGLLRRAWEAVTGIDGGPEAPTLARPFGVAALPGDAFAVADPDRPALLRVDAGGAREIRCDGLPWAAPFGVAEFRGRLLVADAGLPALVLVEADGPCTVLAPGLLGRPTAVAAIRDRIAVLDSDSGEIVVLDSDGNLLQRAGGGPVAPLVSGAWGIAAGGDDTFVVTSSLFATLSRWTRDGAPLGRFGPGGDPLVRPKGVAVGGDRRVYVADAGRDAVVVLDPGGEVEYTVGETGSTPGRFAHPAGIAVTENRLLVADSLNARVQVFEILGGRP